MSDHHRLSLQVNLDYTTLPAASPDQQTKRKLIPSFSVLVDGKYTDPTLRPLGLSEDQENVRDQLYFAGCAYLRQQEGFLTDIRHGDPMTPEGALEELANTVEAAGGLVRNQDGAWTPVGDPTWVDLAYAYLSACQVLGRRPLIDEETVLQVEEPDYDSQE